MSSNGHMKNAETQVKGLWNARVKMSLQMRAYDRHL